MTSANMRRELEWVVGRDTGISSLTIFAVMVGVEPARAGIPWDGADFGRCYRLLGEFPEWRTRLGEVADCYPEWRDIVANWKQLEKLYRLGQDMTRALRGLRVAP